MSHLLWKSYWQDDVDRFRRLLAPGGHNVAAASARSPTIGGAGSPHVGGGVGPGAVVSPGPAPGTSPRTPKYSKARRSSAFGATGGGGGGGGPGGAGLGRAEVNSRDHAGLTILLRAAASSSASSVAFVRALLGHPGIDIYARDPESGWNALHRALYAGNISVARLLLAKERADLADGTSFAAGGSASVSRIGQLIKTKDNEGNSPFDLFAASIGELARLEYQDQEAVVSPLDDEPESDMKTPSAGRLKGLVEYGEELFVFGSNKNMSLGVGDESDRQYPERIHLRRPDHLLYRFYDEYLDEVGLERPAVGSLRLEELPATILTRPIRIKDVVLSKLHSAVLTTDPVSNLYMCGVGRGGRLGLSDDQRVRFTFVPVQGGLADRKVVRVALGQDHSLAVTDLGELWTWGSNACGQLGYSLPPPVKVDEEPMSLTPRQVFGPLRRELVQGVAASAIHSVAYSDTSLYCWGKNVGQLALMDSDSRSLDFQTTPRRVAASLFSSTIAMVSAIDKATAVLLENHTVCIFTSYGYNFVKFPAVDPFANYRIRSFTPRRRLGGASGRSGADDYKICHIASGGETIAAVTGRGDLFVLPLNPRVAADTGSSPSVSTTNPSKIKEAVGQPQCIWSAKKDGVTNVGVSDHGSVIISTDSGAVWRRVMRATAKDAYTAAAGASAADVKKRKAFKFQRVPGITHAVGVRSSAFGAFAAVRRDSRILKEHISINDQAIWNDLGPLLCLTDFRPTCNEIATAKHAAVHNQEDELDDDRLKLSKVLLDAADLESDLMFYLKGKTKQTGSQVEKEQEGDKEERARRNRGPAFETSDYDAVVCSSSHPGLQFPIHSWLLAARSPVFRKGFADYRSSGFYRPPPDEIFTIEDVDGMAEITVSAVDFITVLNLVVYIYRDHVVPFWALSGLPSRVVQRYRQIRVDLMKVAGKLGLSKLEAAARIQTQPVKSLPADLDSALEDPAFVDTGDVVIELDGDEILAHNSLLRRRCPFFEGLFHGRSEGMWLAERRDAAGPSGRVPIDLTHFDPLPFGYVMRYLYGDVGVELFDSTVSASFDDFTDLVMDVLAIANELMLDRLSQICQKVIGRFVTTRTIAGLLNEISPCSVSEFKDAGLEYVCSQMETMLENHLLDDLEEELLLELDEVVRANQRASCPNATGWSTEESLHRRYPDLAFDIQEERQIRVKEMAFKATQRDDDRKFSSSFKARVGSLDDSSLSPFLATPERTESVAKKQRARNEPFSPSLRPKASATDLMFDMEEEERPAVQTQTPARPAGRPWQASSLPASKLDLRDIMTEASADLAVAASPRISGQRANEGAVAKASMEVSPRPLQQQPQQPPTKLSQKEKKRIQQQQLATRLAAAAPEGKGGGAWETARTPASASASPWKVAPTSAAIPKISLSESLATPPAATPPPSAGLPKARSLVVAAEAPSTEKSPTRRAASPDTRFPGQARRPQPSPQQLHQQRAAKQPAAQPTTSGTNSPSVSQAPYSKSYIPSPAAAAAAAAALSDPDARAVSSLYDIIGEQRREQEVVREAAAKRSLMEIQQEQAFQEWWDQESRRAQEEEARRRTTAAGGDAAAAAAGGSGRGSSAGGARGDGAGGGRGRRMRKTVRDGRGGGQKGGDRAEKGDGKGGEKAGERGGRRR